ncbi:4'-phosphopantetheinyl transferase superfamily protein [Shewanella yunxiaonensis]|uniref:4'-phosphopantetheinyl transferase superfamily protein n=1 Tax=Shewanella yunxiaonensis TaxID=2829809 RepID=A0ABX7YRY8_9GAMM|nr:4'-phosphopantetheinyl transferase superfamily protein [Shewanella yunxiaonensis]QUN04901.1 4'-phosphopantetheinyl transferase superfamily protein [Shewanella yunxiaonensis]
MIIRLYCHRYKSSYIQAPSEAASPTSRRRLNQQLLRYCLSLHQNFSPDDWRFQTGAHGKPTLIDIQQAHSQLQFNLSHSRDWLVIAVLEQATTSSCVGVDVEQIKRSRNIRSIAEHYFSAAEQAQLMALSKEDYTAAFYRLWVMKEAYVKATGQGLSQGLNTFSFDLNSSQPLANFSLNSVSGDGFAQHFSWCILHGAVGDTSLALAVGSESPFSSANGDSLNLYRVCQDSPDTWYLQAGNLSDVIAVPGDCFLADVQSRCEKG